MLLAAEHFVRAPNWQWWILAYFFFAGLTGGCYALAAMLRLWGDSRDEAAARIAVYTSFVTVILCPIFLTVDLGASWTRFWHMLINVSPGDQGLIFKYRSPMSVGAWALLVFAIFPTVSTLEALVLDKRLKHPAGDALTRLLSGGFGRAFNVVGAIGGLYIASYTGVLLSVSNQPLWSDTWALGGLFLASGLGGSAALVMLLARYRHEAEVTEGRLREAEGYFAGLEMILIVAFMITVAVAGTITRTLGMPWLLLWLVAVAGLVAPLAGVTRPMMRVGGSGGAALATAAVASTTWVSLLVLVGVLALRMAVIFSAQ